MYCVVIQEKNPKQIHRPEWSSILLTYQNKDGETVKWDLHTDHDISLRKV